MHWWSRGELIRTPLGFKILCGFVRILQGICQNTLFSSIIVFNFYMADALKVPRDSLEIITPQEYASEFDEGEERKSPREPRG